MLQSKKTLIFLLGEFLTKIVPFIFLPYFLKKLNGSEFNDMMIIMAWSSFYLIMILISADSHIIKKSIGYKKKRIDELSSVNGLTSTLIYFFVLLMYFFIEVSYIHLYGLTIGYGLALSRIVLALKQIDNNLKKYVTIQFLISGASILFSVAYFELFEPDLFARLNIFILVLILISYRLLYESFSLIKKLPKFSKIFFINSMFFGLPLLLNGVANFLRYQGDKIIIQEFVDQTTLTNYLIGAQYSTVILILVTALSRSVEIDFYKALKNNNNTAVRAFFIVFLFLFLIINFLTTIFCNYLELYIPFPGYEDSIIYFKFFVYSYSFLILSIPLVFLFYYHNKLKFYTLITLSFTFFYMIFMYICLIFNYFMMLPLLISSILQYFTLGVFIYVSNKKDKI